MDNPLDTRGIAVKLNESAHTHAIGELQSIRAELKGLRRRAGSEIFSSQTIHEHWAFHHGGRSELQFNIGTEEVSDFTELRHGVAFSFELGQTLPTIDVLIPKVRLFNDYMALYPEAYADMRMWHYQAHERSGAGNALLYIELRPHGGKWTESNLMPQGTAFTARRRHQPVLMTEIHGGFDGNEWGV